MDAKKENFIMLPENIAKRGDLSLGAKILYGFIKSYSITNGKCWAGNPYIAGYFTTNERTITRWVKELKDKKLIDVKYYRKADGQIEKRMMQPLNENTKTFDVLDEEMKNDIERVNKKWLENYISLYEKQPSKKNWNPSIISNIKRVLKKVGIEKLLTALDTAMNDEYCINTGYNINQIISHIDKYLR